jgi:aspartyl-tRNA(Asn)/glutamyl-tRNA(Gln) amidotransferase subunit C
MSSNQITNDVISKTAKLARITVPPDEAKIYTSQLEPILEHFASLNKIDVKNIEPTYQVTGLKNIMRDDVVDVDRMFTQKQALLNAPKSKNGYFVTAATIKK